MRIDPYEVATEISPLLSRESQESRELNVNGGMSYVGPNVPYEFKTSRVRGDGGWTRGMVCASSIMDKDELIDIIVSIPSAQMVKTDIDKANASKGLLCTMIELFLRLEGGGSFTRCSAAGVSPPHPLTEGASAPWTPESPSGRPS